MGGKGTKTQKMDPLTVQRVTPVLLQTLFERIVTLLDLDRNRVLRRTGGSSESNDVSTSSTVTVTVTTVTVSSESESKADSENLLN